MAERSREGLAGGFLSAVRRRAFVPGAKSGGSPAVPSSRSAYHFTASIKSPKSGACSVTVAPSAAWRVHSKVRGYKRSSSGSTVAYDGRPRAAVARGSRPAQLARPRRHAGRPGLSPIGQVLHG